MTQVILLKIMAVAVASFVVFWTIDELVRHIRYRDRPHRWQWKASAIENRTADIMWISDRRWMVFRFIASLAMMVVVIFRVSQ